MQICLHPFLCEHRAGEPQLIECQQAIWIDPHKLRGYRFPPANEDLIERVIGYFNQQAGERGAAR